MRGERDEFQCFDHICLGFQLPVAFGYPWEHTHMVPSETEFMYIFRGIPRKKNL